MREFLRNLPILLLFFFLFSVLLGEAKLDEYFLVIEVKVRVDDSCLVLLICCIEDLQHVLADELIVGIQGNNHRVRGAVVVRSDVDVFQGSFPLFVLDVYIVFPVDVVEVEPLTVDLVAVVGGGVVDEDQEVVGVVLLEDRIEVVLDAELGVVVVARCYDAHRQLLRVLLEAPDLVNPLILGCLELLLLGVPALVELIVEGDQIDALHTFLVPEELFPLPVEDLPFFPCLLVVDNLINSNF